MKKLLTLTLLLCSFFFIGCNTTDLNNSNEPDMEITYFEDFNYLPMYPGAEKVSYTPPEQEGTVGKGVYIIPEDNLNEASSKYTKILKDNGWEVNQDESNPFLDCKKGDHTAAILFSIKNDKPTLEVLAK